MTTEQVRILVGKQLGFSREDSIRPSNLSQEDAVKLGDYTFAYIASNPDQFTPSQVQIASNMVRAWGTNTPLQDTSFNWSLLASEIGNNIEKAGVAIAGIGEGVLNTAKIAKYAIPTLGIALAVYLLWKKFGNK